MSERLLILALLLFSGCTATVKPWEKEQLASESMQPDGGNKLQKQSQEHVYFSKEGTKGGSGVSGGGCGCN